MNKLYRVKDILVGMLLMATLVGLMGAASTQKEITVTTGIPIYVDGVKINPTDGNGNPVDTFIYNGTTYVPLRAVSEYLGKAVKWDGNNSSVYIGKDPRQIVNKVELVRNFIWDETQEAFEYAVITAYSDTGKIVWNYETPKCVETEMDAIVELGQKENRYYFSEDSSVVCLDLQTGAILWKNDDFPGRVSGFAFGSNAIYLCGQYGPDFYAISYEGQTLSIIERFDENYCWASEIELLGDKAAVYLRGGTINYDTPKIFYVNLNTYEVSTLNE